MLVNVKKKLVERRKELESNRGALADASIHFGWVRYGHQAALEAPTIVLRLKPSLRFDRPYDGARLCPDVALAVHP